MRKFEAEKAPCACRHSCCTCVPAARHLASCHAWCVRAQTGAPSPTADGGCLGIHCPALPRFACRLSATLPLVHYLTIVGLLAWCLSLALGSVGFLSSLTFTHAVFKASRSGAGGS